MQTWQKPHDKHNLTGIGNPNLLDLPMTAFFSSRQCPSVAIRAAMDWALQQAKAKAVVVGGFHAPLEQSVLKVLIQARSSAVVILARPAGNAKLPPEWADSLASGRMAVVSVVDAGARLTQAVATARNNTVADLAAQVVIAYASPAGGLRQLAATWHAAGKPVQYLQGQP